MSGEQRALLAQLQQQTPQGQQAPQYPAQGNPVLGLQIPQIQKFAARYPAMAQSPYVMPFYNPQVAPYDWQKMFAAGKVSLPGALQPQMAAPQYAGPYSYGGSKVQGQQERN
jgi:hypothetical protein